MYLSVFVSQTQCLFFCLAMQSSDNSENCPSIKALIFGDSTTFYYFSTIFLLRPRIGCFPHKKKEGQALKKSLPLFFRMHAVRD